MERQALLAAVLCLLVLFGYQAAIDYLYPAPADRQASDSDPSLTPASPVAEAPILAPPVPVVHRELPTEPAAEEPVDLGTIVQIETELYSAAVSTTGGRLTSFRLKQFRTSIAENSGPLEMIQVAPGSAPPLGLRFQSQDGSVEDDTRVQYEANRGDVVLGGEATSMFELSGTLPSGARVEKILTFRGDAYPIDLEVRAPDLPATTSQVGVGWRHQLVDPARDRAVRYRGAMVLQDRKLILKLAKSLVGKPPEIYEAPVTWAGYADQHFIAAMVPEKPTLASAIVSPDKAGVQILLSGARGAAGEGTRFTLYIGPKDVQILEAAGHELQRAVNLGWFSFLAIPLLRLLKIFHAAIPNYGIDIILLTMLIKVLFMPLTTKSMKSMRAMQKLQPQMAKLREKFKDDKEALNKEMIELYRRHHVNPLGGCLPMVLQFPVFLGLYRGLNSAIELRHAPFVFWIKDLSTYECYPWPGQVTAVGCNELSLFGLPIPALVLLMGASMLLQQWMTPSSGMDPTQQRMMMIVMPAVFTVMFVTFPSGLVLYWLVNNFLTIAQQWWTNRSQDQPQHA